MKIFCTERGVAILTAMLLLFLVSSLSLSVFQNAATEQQIAAYSTGEYASLSLAESGIEQVLSWFMDPLSSPNPSFFKKQACKKKNQAPDFIYTSSPSENASPFSDLQAIGNQIDVRIYKSSYQPPHSAAGTPTATGTPAAGVCTVEVVANHGRKVKVDLAQRPMAPITAAVQGVHPNQTSPEVVAHWGPIRAIGDAGLDLVDLIKLKPFIKRFGRYLIISPVGRMEENGVDLGLFDDLFMGSELHNLVFIDTREGYSAPSPLQIKAGDYKGYFYFSGDIHIVGVGKGRPVLATPPPPPNTPLPEMIDPIDLEGFFYTPGKIILEGPFRIYGAIYAGSGFEGDGANRLAVWYNDLFRLGAYKGVIPLIPIPGSWRTL